MDKEKLCYDLSMLCVKKGLEILNPETVEDAAIYAAKTYAESHRIIKDFFARTKQI